MTSNETVVRRWVEEMWNGPDRSLCEELIGDRFVEHARAPFSETEPGEGHGPAMMRSAMDWLLAQFPDLSMSVEAILSDGDIVATRVRSEGTNTGPLNGALPPTGKRFSSEQSHWFRLADGKIVEHWATRDDLTVMVQLGMVRVPPRPS
jgi:predicted ester cyclase